MTYDQALRRASGHYLYKHLPEEWNQWQGDKLDKFIDKYKCELVENQPIHTIYEYIETLAIDFIKAIRENAKDLEK